MASASATTKIVTFKLPESSENEAESAARAVLPKTPHPKKLRPAESAQQTLASASSDVSHPDSNPTPKSIRPPEEKLRPPSRPATERDASFVSAGSDYVPHPNSNVPPKPPAEDLRPPSSHPASERHAFVKNGTSDQSEGACKRSRSALYREQKGQVRIRPSDTAHAVNTVRERTNSASREHISSIKYNVAKLREHLLRVEEEIRQTTRGKNTLELAVQDVRRAMSINQQSVSMQQRRSKTERVSGII